MLLYVDPFCWDLAGPIRTEWMQGFGHNAWGLVAPPKRHHQYPPALASCPGDARQGACRAPNREVRLPVVSFQAARPPLQDVVQSLARPDASRCPRSAADPPRAR